MERTSNNGLTAWKARIAALARRYPRLTRAGGWALLGGAAAFPGLRLAVLLLTTKISWLTQFWTIGPLEIGPAPLLGGLLYSGALGLLLWRGGHVGPARAAGFALFAMFWFAFGIAAGSPQYCLFGCGPLGNAPVFVAGFLVAGAWMTLACLLFLPGLRVRRGAWPFARLLRLVGAGLIGAMLAGTAASFPVAYIAEALLGEAWLEHVDLIIAAWGAAYAAALSHVLPPRKA